MTNLVILKRLQTVSSFHSIQKQIQFIKRQLAKPRATRWSQSLLVSSSNLHNFISPGHIKNDKYSSLLTDSTPL